MTEGASPQNSPPPPCATSTIIRTASSTSPNTSDAEIRKVGTRLRFADLTRRMPSGKLLTSKEGQPGAMGFFDPTHKKIVARAPAYFAVHAMIAEKAILAAIEALRPEREDSFRTAVIGMVALWSAERQPTVWSRDAVDFATTAANKALHQLSPRSVTIVEQAYEMVVETLSGPMPSPISS